MAIKPIPYSKKDLFAVRPPETLTGDRLNEVAFPIGGIGTGSISLTGRGGLIDWEIFSRPGKGFRPDQSFFSIWAKKGKEEPIFRVLEERLVPHFHGPRENPYEAGPQQRHASGLPRLEKVAFTGSYPIAKIDYQDPKLPLAISMEAWNPFIPTNDRDSSIPVALFKFRVKNPNRTNVKATLALNVQNVCGQHETELCANKFFDTKTFRGIDMSTKKFTPDSPRYGTMTLATSWKNVTWQTNWIREGWWNPLQHFCNTFVRNGRFDEDGPQKPLNHRRDIGSLGLKVDLKPGQEKEMVFVLAWHFPWHERYWQQPCCNEGGKACYPKWKNYYATQWKDARAVTKYAIENLDRLENETRAFHDALFGSSLPAVALDAASSQMSILKSPTCIRLEDGTFYGWEGCCPGSGCCDGTCTHVWNYAQALPYLFPKLERGIRDAHFENSLRESDGHTQFRMPLPLGTKAEHKFHAAADGQLGDIMKVYRDYLICGDLKWLKDLWPKVKLALEYAWKEWDPDKDGILDGIHHNTYDIEFHGAEPLAETFYLGALRAGEEIARIVGDTEAADEYRKIFESGRKKMNRICWNGEYFFQKMNPKKGTVYQYGKGCLTDQMIGQWYAEMLGLGYLLDPEKVKSSLESIFRYNWVTDFLDHVNPQRIYALNDEAGLLLCSWPKGGRMEFPFVYSDEVWTGIEYQAASHMIYEGLVEEGLAIVKGARDRHDGMRRNPWNEIECGNHYARAMASWAILLALAGFSYSAPEKRIGLAPRVNADDFKTFFSVDSGWGVLKQSGTNKGISVEVEVLYGTLELATVDVGKLKRPLPTKATVTAAGNRLSSDLAQTEGAVRVTFPKTKLKAGQSVKVTLG